MCKRSSKIISRLLVVTLLMAMLIVLALPIASLAAESSVSTPATTTPGTSENLRYFKEDTNYEMSDKVAPMTIEFELAACGGVPGASNGGVIVSNYSEDASTYLIVEVETYGKIRVRGKYNGGSEWTAQFYQSEADVRLNGVHHYTVTVASGWTGVTLYADGVKKATRYPASITLPKASEYTHPFRIGGDYTESNSDYFKGLIYSVAMYNDVRTDSEVSADIARTKNWSNSDGLIAAYDLTKMGEAALRDYSDNGNKLIYNNGSGIQVENFGKYEITDPITSNIETFEAWVYMPKSIESKTIGGTIIGNYRSYNGARVLLEVYLAGNPRLSYTNANGTTSYHRFTDVDLRTGTWQHLTVVHDTATGEARCYVNGELKQTVTENVVAYADNALDQKFLIGRDTALRYAEGDGEYWENRKDQYFKGFVKEIRLYSDVRSDSEIAADYAGSLDKSELIAAYEINPENAYGDISDLSDNGYDVTYNQLLWEAEYVDLAKDYAYSLAIVGDTQTVNDQNPEFLKTIYQWIIDNKDSKNIQYVVGLGDITEYGVDEGHKNYTESKSNQQWADAKEAITLMDGILPYSLIRGDGHDGIEMFNKYFGSHDPYLENITGYYEEGRIDNVYHTFKIGEADYLLLCLDHGTKDDVLVWANEVVASHPNHRVIVTTHQYLQSDGTLCESWETGNATAYDPTNNAADGLWDKFLSKHANISMVICGHSDANGVVVTKKTAVHGNEVTQILINPQGMDAEYYHGSKGMVAMLYFSADGQSVQVEYYSTIKGTYYPSDDFTVSYGTDSHDYKATVTAPDCENGGYTTYTCTACGESYVDNQTAPLGHTRVTLEGKAPTCTETGLDSGAKCSTCGTVFDTQEEIPALGHFEVYISAIDPTCTVEGRTEGVGCTICDTVLSGYTEIPALGHNYAGTETLAPTCTEKGIMTYVCQNDASHTYTEEIAANGHSYSSAVTAPDCENGGYTNYTCSACGDSYTANATDALGHSYSSDVTAPTCESAGYTTHTCATCGNSYTDGATDALGHSYTSTQTLAPTCTEKGIMTYVCQNDASHTYTEEIAANGHSYNSVVTAPDCENGGYTTYTCSVCSHSYTDSATDALGHSSKTLSGKAPTCTDTGLTDGSECSVCGDTLVPQTEIPANGHTDLDPKDFVCDVCDTDLCIEHDEETISGKAPTCTDTGLTDGKKCSICGEILLAQQVVPATGHSFTNYVPNNDATCQADGTETAKCDNCDETNTRTDEDSKLAHEYFYPCDAHCMNCYELTNEDASHTLTHVDAVAPTCTANGNVEYYVCNDCGTAWDNADCTGMPLNRYTVIVPMVDHEYFYACDAHCMNCGELTNEDASHTLTHVEAVAPTCTTDGNVEYYICNDCGTAWDNESATGMPLNRYTVIVPAAGHDYEAIVTEPDCENGGYTTYTCSACDDSYVADETEALGHDWADATTEAPKTCNNCGATEGDKLPEPEPEPDVEPDPEVKPDDTPETTPDEEAPVQKNHNECEPKNDWDNFWLAIINFFRAIFGLPAQCYCGEEIV